MSATVHGNVPCLTRGSGTRQTRVIIVVIIIAGASGDAEEAQLDLRPPRAVLSADDSAISCATSANIAPKQEGQTRKKIWGGSSHEAFCEDDAVARGGRHAPHTAVDLPLGEVHKTLGQRHVRFVRARQAAEAPCRNAVFVELYFMFVPDPAMAYDRGGRSENGGTKAFPHRRCSGCPQARNRQRRVRSGACRCGSGRSRYRRRVCSRDCRGACPRGWCPSARAR